jgi:hypothetical protein
VPTIQVVRDLLRSIRTLCGKVEDCTDAVNLPLRARHKDGSIRFYSLSLALLQEKFPTAVWRYSHAAQPISGFSHNSISEEREAALARGDFYSQFAAVFSGHRSFQGFHHRTGKGSVVMELFCAVAHRYTCILAKKLIVGSLIDILKASKPTHIVNENSLVSGFAARNIMKQTAELLTMFDRNTALPSIRIGRGDDITMALRVGPNRGLLVGDRILLVLC